MNSALCLLNWLFQLLFCHLPVLNCLFQPVTNNTTAEAFSAHRCWKRRCICRQPLGGLPQSSMKQPQVSPKNHISPTASHATAYHFSPPNLQQTYPTSKAVLIHQKTPRNSFCFFHVCKQIQSTEVWGTYVIPPPPPNCLETKTHLEVFL